MSTLGEQFTPITVTQREFLKWVFDHASEYRPLAHQEKMTLKLVIAHSGYYKVTTKQILNVIRKLYLSDYLRDRK